MIVRNIRIVQADIQSTILELQISPSTECPENECLLLSLSGLTQKLANSKFDEETDDDQHWKCTS